MSRQTNEEVIRLAVEGDAAAIRKLERLEAVLARLSTGQNVAPHVGRAYDQIAGGLQRARAAALIREQRGAGGMDTLGEGLSRFLSGSKAGRPVTLVERLAEATQGHRISDTGRVMQNGLPLYVKAMFAGYAVKTAFSGVQGLAQGGAELAAVRENFVGLSGGAAEASKRLRKLREDVGGILSDKALMVATNNIRQTGAMGRDKKPLSDEVMAEMLRGVVRLGAGKGYSAEESTKRLTEAISTTSSAQLDNILAGFNFEQFLNKFVENNPAISKKDVTENAQLRQSLVVEAIRQSLAENMKQFPEGAGKASDAANRLDAMLENAKNQLIEAVATSPEFRRAVEGMTEALRTATPRIAEVATTALSYAGQLANSRAGGIMGAAMAGAYVGSAAGPWGTAGGLVFGATAAMGAAEGSWIANSGDAEIKREEAAEIAKADLGTTAEQMAAYDAAQKKYVADLVASGQANVAERAIAEGGNTTQGDYAERRRAMAAEQGEIANGWLQAMRRMIPAMLDSAERLSLLGMRVAGEAALGGSLTVMRHLNRVGP